MVLVRSIACRENVHALSCKEKRVYVGELTFGPWWLVLGIIEPHVFGPLVLVIYGIDP